MPPFKLAFTRERIEGFATLALERAQERLVDDGVAFQHMSCEYRGVRTGDGSADLTAKISGPCTLVYEWQVHAGESHEDALVSVRCDAASTQGVPLPATWRTALKCRRGWARFRS